MYDVTTFGEILIDFTDLGKNENNISLFAQNPGGAPANVAVAVSKLSGNSAFIGKAGDDMHGRYLKKVLDEQNVDTQGMILDPDYFTTLAFVAVDERGERTFSFARKPGADTKIHASELSKDILSNSKILHIGSLSLTNEPSRSATLYAIESARNSGALISYDPNYRDSLWPDEETACFFMRSLIPEADVMKISDEETDLLTPYKDPEQAARDLIDQGVKAVVVTLGSKGALVANAQGSVIVPGFKSKVQDTNGAGDSFWAGFLYKISQDDRKLDDIPLDVLADYAKFANGVAACCVRGAGAIPAMPCLEEVEALLEVEG